MPIDKNIDDLVSVGIIFNDNLEDLYSILDIILGQTYPYIEVIILDSSNKTDEVDKVIRHYFNVFTSLKYFKNNHNFEIADTFKFFLEKATGEYFTIICSKQSRSPEYIEILVSYLKKDKSNFCCLSDFHFIDQSGIYKVDSSFYNIEYYKPFQVRNKYSRIVSFFLQNDTNKKNNIIYGVFRTEKLKSINFQKFYKFNLHNNQLTFLNFQLIQIGPIVLIDNLMATLIFEFQNLEIYFNGKYHESKLSLRYSLTQYFITTLLYFNHSKSLLSSILLFIFCLPKMISFFIKKLLSFLYKLNYNFKFVSEFTFKKIKSENSVQSNLEKLKLTNVTLLAVSTRDTEEALQALVYSSEKIDFAEIKLLSNYTPLYVDKKIKTYRIPKARNIDDWCRFIVYDLHKYVETEFVLLIHADGFIVNPASWRSDFLQYDYIGSPWPIPENNFAYRDVNGKLIRVGNSVSIRSKKILELPTSLSIPWIPDHGSFNEDTFLCCTNRHILESNGIQYAPLDIAKYFAHEKMIPEIKNIIPFAFHKWEGSNSIYPKFYKRRKINYFSRFYFQKIFSYFLASLKLERLHN